MSNPDGSHDAAGPDECVETEQEGTTQESFSFDDELAEAFGTPRSIFSGGGYATTTGGLPEQLDPNDVADAHAPPFLRSNQCCIADRSEYVVRDAVGNIVETYAPAAVTRSPNGGYATVKELREPEIERLRAADWERLRPLIVQQEPKRLLLRVVVEPKRRECEHLVRQLTPPTPSQQAAGTVRKGWMRRYCAARRTTAGAFLELTDQQMSACSLRSPFDLEGASRLDEFDDALEHRSENREHVDMFKLVSQRLLPVPEAGKEGTTDP